jgi:hypothetical protein
MPAARIPPSQPMTPALYSVLDVHAYPVVDQNWDRVLNFLNQEESAYRLAALLYDIRLRLGIPASKIVALELWKTLLGKDEGHEFDSFDRKVLEAVTKQYEMVVSLLDPPPPPVPDHALAINNWDTKFRGPIQRRRDELTAWITRQNGHG